MSYKNFQIQQEGNIFIFTFDRPDIHNSMEMPLFRIELNDILDEFAADPVSRVGIFRNSGKFFCSGTNLNNLYSDLTGERRQELLGGWRDQRIVEIGRVVKKLNNLAKPVIAVVNGAAAGGGANLAISCDFVFISEHTTFHQSFVNINLIPDSGGLWSLARYVGPRKAMEMAMTGDPVGAQEALRIGLVNKVYPEAELDGAALEFARKLASKPPGAIKAIKRLCNLMPELSRDTYCAMEADIMAQLIAQEDSVNAIANFLARRRSR